MVWFYQELTRRIGEKKYNIYLKVYKYGKHNIEKDLTTFLLYESSACHTSHKSKQAFLVKLHKESPSLFTSLTST
jgi:beta-lactamase class D